MERAISTAMALNSGYEFGIDLALQVGECSNHGEQITQQAMRKICQEFRKFHAFFGFLLTIAPQMRRCFIKHIDGYNAEHFADMNHASDMKL